MPLGFKFSPLDTNWQFIYWVKIMKIWNTHHHAPASLLCGTTKKFNISMSANGNAHSQTKLKNFTLQDAGPSSIIQSEKCILYTHCLCPYAERAWLALLEKVKRVSPPSLLFATTTLNPSSLLFNKVKNPT
jgi:hypothetical protein